MAIENNLPVEPEGDLNETLNRSLGMLLRRRWLILLATSLGVFGTLLALSRIPNRYSSEATLLVMQQQIPQRYVLPTTTTDLREALQATTQEVLSRDRLLQIIEEFGLYQKEKMQLSPEGLLDLIRQDIQILPIETQSTQRDINSFKISFSCNSPHLAQEVTSKLTSLFIEQNLATREHQASTTTKFLREQREAARSKLADAEEQVQSFKMKNLGELPEQQAGNLAVLSALQSELQTTMASLSRTQEQRQYLQSLSAYRAMAIEADLTRLRAEKTSLLNQYTPQYPAVIKITEKISQTEALLRTLKSGQVAEALVESREKSSSGAEQDNSLAQLGSQLEANRLEIENLTKEEAKLKAGIEQYQARLNQTPLREQQLAGILRNYEQLKQDYADWLNKELQSESAADLEKRQEGQQFRIIDQPSLPTIPAAPKRIKISLGGAGGGLALGVALAFLLEIRNQTFRSGKELKSRFVVPFVFEVPELATPAERQATVRKQRIEWIAGTVLALTMFCAEFYEYYLYRHG